MIVPFLVFIHSFVFSAELNFDKALQIALNDNQEIKIENAKVDSAKWSLKSATYKFLPQVSANATHQKSGDPETDLRTYGLSADLNLFHGGADQAAQRAAAERENQAHAEREATQLEIEGELAEIFFDFIQQQEEIKILSSGLENQKRFLTVSERKYKNGAIPLEQLDKIRIDTSNSEAEVRDAELVFAKKIADLQTRIGQNSLLPIWPWRGLLQNESKLSPLIGKFKSELLELLPDWRASQARRKALEYESRQALGNILPRIDFRYSLLTQEEDDKTSHGWTGLITISVPIWNQMADYSAYRIQKNEESIEIYKQDLLKKNLTADFKLALQNFNTALQTAKDREFNLEAAKRLLQSSQRRFATGRTQADEFNLDKQRVVQAELLVSRGWKAAHTAFIKFVHGRGTSILEIPK